MIARAFALFAALACAAALPAAAQNFSPPPRPDRYVTDTAGALSPSAKTAIGNELQAFESKTGHRVLVWIGQTTGGVPLETFTTQTADAWKVGRKGKDDGAVLFAFMQDHKVRIEVGYGLEGTLTDAGSYRIIQDDILPKMRAQDADGAIESGVAAMLTTIDPSYTLSSVPSPAPASDDTSSNVGAIVVIVIILIFVTIVIVRASIAAKHGYTITRGGAYVPSPWFGGFSGGSSGGGGGGGFSSGGFGGGFGGGGASGSW